MIIDGIEYRKYNDDYLISRNGDVYSTITNSHLKHLINVSGHHYVDIYGKHTRIHRMVFEAWNRNLLPGEQVNHKDDNKNNNDIDNLYAGTQKENILDSIVNGSRCLHCKSITVFDQSINTIITFPSIKYFIEYDGHSNQSGNISKTLKTKWFNERYNLINIENVETIEKQNILNAKYRTQLKPKLVRHL